MIHIIPHQIGKGSWVGWYDIIEFIEPHIFHEFNNKIDIERKIIGEPPYESLLHEHLKIIKPNPFDSIFIDIGYLNYNSTFEEFDNYIIDLSKEYKCKFFIVDGDNINSYKDTPYYTYFSNRFFIENMNKNFNYFRYRSPKYENIKNTKNFISPYLINLRQKKMNMIVGVDKIFRLLSLKHVYDIGLNVDSYIGYSAFHRGYDDSEISESLIKFRDSTIPVILDIPMERSIHGAVNVEYPPLPITLNSYISCILESQIILHNELHVSEKTWNPFISYNIPLILGSYRLNEYLKKLGFWLAEDLFDLSPPIKSGESIIQNYTKNLNIINSLSIKEIHDYYIENIHNMHNNYDLLMNQKFHFNSDNYKKYPKECL
jgi:hypothetical protein